MSAVPAPADADPAREPVTARGTPGASHVVQFYEDVDFLTETVATFLTKGWEEGSPIIVVARPDHSARIAEKLQSRGIAAADRFSAGRLVFLDAEATLSTFMAGSKPDPDLFAAELGRALEKAASVGRPGAPTRVYGEMVDLVWKDGNPAAAIRIEELWNDLGTRHAFALMCGYHMDRFAVESDAERFAAVCSTHAHVGPAEGFSGTPDDEGRRREVSRLQQRERVLETELAYRKQLEEIQRQSLMDLKQSQEALQRTVRFSEMFLGVLGHDLRNPLGAIVTSASHIRRRSADESLRRPIGRILSSADRMTRMIDQLLDFTQIRLGTGIRLNCRTLDVRAVITDVLDELQAVHPDCGISTELSGDTCCFGDDDRLAQMISNLTGNAIQHRLPPAPVRIQVDGSNPDVLLLEVQNEGTVPEDMLPVLFEPFHGAAERRTATSSGLGLGLFISKQIALAHGGTIDVVSTAAAGTRVLVALPRDSGAHLSEASFLTVPSGDDS